MQKGDLSFLNFSKNEVHSDFLRENGEVSKIRGCYKKEGGEGGCLLFSFLLTISALYALWVKYSVSMTAETTHQRYFYPILALNGVVPLSRAIKTFGIFHGKKSIGEGDMRLFRPLILFQSKKRKNKNVLKN